MPSNPSGNLARASPRPPSGVPVLLARKDSAAVELAMGT